MQVAPPGGMRWFVRLLAVFGALACWLAGGRASAAVILAEGDAAVVERAWVAVAVAPEQTTTWLAVGTREAGRFGVVVPLHAGMRIDFGERMWLDVLERVSAPRIMPPAELVLPDCASDQPGVDVASQPLPAATVEPLAMVTVPNLDALVEGAATFDLAVSDTAQHALRTVAEKWGFLLVVYEASEASVVTNPLRVVALGDDPVVPAGSLRAGTDHDFGVTYFTLGEGPLLLGGTADLPANALDVRWHVASGQSDYLVARETDLRLSAEPLQIVEPVASQLFYEWETLPDDGGVVQSLARCYLEAAAEPERVDDCVAVTVAIRSGGLRVARACVPGAVVTIPAATGEPLPCDQTSEVEPIDPHVLRCGGADELAVAHSGLAPDVRLTRLVARLTDDFPLSARLTLSGAATDTSVVRADRLDESDCEPAGGVASGGSSGWIPSGAVTAPGTTSVGGVLVVSEDDPNDYYADDGWYWDTTVVVDDDGTSCSGSTEPDTDYSGETCSGDSSDTDYSGETCSGDSSDTDYSGETCGGDGSGEGCSGDSSDSEYSGETCSSGSADSGYSGETCSGDCSVSRRRRPRLSSLVFTLAALLIVLRRIRRSRGARALA